MSESRLGDLFGGPPAPQPSDGTLTDEQRTKFLEHINSKTNLVGKCPICGTRQWSILAHFLNGIVFHPGGSFVIGGPSYPHVGMICGNCGNTQLVNAVVAGILPGAPADTPDKPGGSNV